MTLSHTNGNQERKKFIDDYVKRAFDRMDAAGVPYDRNEGDRMSDTLKHAAEAWDRLTEVNDMITNSPDDNIKATSESPSAATGDGIRARVRRIFRSRTHKFPDKRVEIIQSPETRNQRFIIAPYEPVVDKILTLIAKSQSELLDEAIELLPDKRTHVKELNPRTVGQENWNQGYYRAREDFKATLLTLKERLR